jgi:hypothetical protein
MNYSNIYNMMHATSVRDGVRQSSIPSQTSSDCISSSVDSIRRSPSVFMTCAVHLSMCHCHATQERSSQVSSSYDITIGVTVSRPNVGGATSGIYPNNTPPYYTRGVML